MYVISTKILFAGRYDILPYFYNIEISSVNFKLGCQFEPQFGHVSIY